jgi:parallel beta-helix repeat protein
LNGFRITARPWVVVSGFSITNAIEAGLDIKSASDFSLVANCIVFSNGGRGIRIRDSLGVVVFNSLVYDNGGTGIDFGGEISGAARGAAIHDTVYANGLDGIRVEGVIPSSNLLVLNNVIVDNFGIGLNLKEDSRTGFVGQWNLVTGNQTAAYNTLDIARGALDLGSAPLLVLPAGADGILGGAGYADDDFHLSQLAVGQIADSPAVDASGITAGKVKLSQASTRTDRGLDGGRGDLGFHFGAAVDLMTATGGRVEERLRQFRARAVRCESKTVKAQRALDGGRGPCTQAAALARLERKCGTAVRAACR